MSVLQPAVSYFDLLCDVHVFRVSFPSTIINTQIRTYASTCICVGMCVECVNINKCFSFLHVIIGGSCSSISLEIYTGIISGM